MLKFIANTHQRSAELGKLYIPNLYPTAAGDAGVDGNLGLKSIETPELVYLQDISRLQLGELVELFTDNSPIPVAHTFVMAGDAERESLPLLLPKASIEPDLIDPLVCRINRTGASTYPLRLRVDLKEPAGQDPDPAAPGHQGLRIYLPDDVAVKGVSEERARQGIDITLMPYLNMARGDRALLCWGDQQVAYSVTHADVGHEININVPYEKVMGARDGREVNVRLQVRGHTGNFTDPTARWSAASKVLVYAQRDLLREPYSSAADPQTGIVDLVRLNDKPLIASVFASPDYFEPRDIVKFSFTATDAEGRVSTFAEERPVERINTILDFSVPYEFAAGLAQGHAKLAYVLHKHIGATTMFSQASYVSIQGPRAQWQAPYLLDTMPIAQSHSTGVDGYAYVPYQASWKPQDLITFVWLLADPEGCVEYRFSRSAGERPEQGAIEFVLPAAQTKRFEGRTSEMYYEASRITGSLLGESARKTLLVGERWSPMAAPVVAHAVGNHLDPDLVADGAWVTLPSPPANQDVRLHWFGPGGRIELLVYVPTSGDVRVKVPVKYVLDNLNRVVKVYWLFYQDNVPYRYSSVVTLLIARRGIDGVEQS